MHAGVQGYIVLHLNLITQPDPISYEDILPQYAILPYFAAGHQVAKMPHFGAGTDLGAFVNNGGRMDVTQGRVL